MKSKDLGIDADAVAELTRERDSARDELGTILVIANLESVSEYSGPETMATTIAVLRRIRQLDAACERLENLTDTGEFDRGWAIGKARRRAAVLAELQSDAVRAKRHSPSPVREDADVGASLDYVFQKLRQCENKRNGDAFCPDCEEMIRTWIDRFACS